MKNAFYFTLKDEVLSLKQMKKIILEGESPTMIRNGSSGLNGSILKT